MVAAPLFEATIRLFEEFGSHCQVPLGCTQVDMAKIGGQSGKQTLHILILPVPRRHAMNCERVPQVVKPRLIGRFIVTPMPAIRRKRTKHLSTTCSLMGSQLFVWNSGR